MTRRRRLPPFVQQIVSTQSRIHNSRTTIPVSPQQNALSTIHGRILTRTTAQNALFLQVTKRTLTIGKELAIRKALSPTHLYSSAFVVEKEGDTFTFHGAGWGHGVGLCQIGAAVMSAQGYGYRDIQQHYFKGSEITKIY